MRIGMLGVNHKLASLEMRERFAQLCTKSFADRRIVHPQLAYVLLSTCNRTEIYFHAAGLAEAHTYLLSFLRHDVEQDFDQRVYAFFGTDCFYHLARVTTGLDSAILGETEIQGQVKLAYQEAALQRRLPKELHFLFQKVLKLSKDVRSQIGHPQMGAVMAHTLFEVAQQRLGDLAKKRILFIGLSNINRTIATYFEKKKLGPFTYCNRNAEKLRMLHSPYLLWEEKERWVEFDVIVLGTKAHHYLIEHLPKPIDQDKLLVDLSVPRNVHPKLQEEPHLSLLNMDQLCDLVPLYRRTMCQKNFIEERDLWHLVKRQVGIFELKELAKYRYASPHPTRLIVNNFY